MALVYGTRLRSTSHLPPDEQVECIAATVGRWAHVDAPMVEGSVEDARRKGQVEISLLGERSSGSWAWRLRLIHPDGQDSHLSWAVSATAIRDGDAVDVIVRLDLSRRGGVLARPTQRPAPPGCIAALLDSDDVSFDDGGRQLTTNVWVVDRDDAEALAALVRSPQRSLPVFAFTPRDDDAIDGGMLLPKVLGLAHVVLVKSPATWELDDRLPERLNVYGGAARIWWPGVNDSSNPKDHQLWTGSIDSRRITGQAESFIVEAGRTASLVDHRVLALERQGQKAREAELDRELSEARQVAEEARRELATKRDPQAEDQSARADTVAREAEDRVIAALREDRDAAFALATSLEEDAQAANERADELEGKVAYLEFEVQRLRTQSPAEIGDEGGSISEIEVAIREQIAALGDLDGAKPRAFVVGPKFVATLESHGSKYHQKAIKACADLVVAAPPRLAAREDHPLRTGEGGGDPQRTRRRDGASARRCYIEHNVPAARRLHYWVLDDGSIELASVNVHDDMNIPE